MVRGVPAPINSAISSFTQMPDKTDNSERTGALHTTPAEALRLHSLD